MTIIEAISRVDTGKPNNIPQGEKVRFLSTLDGMIKKNIIDIHSGTEETEFAGYEESTPQDTVLLVGAPFDDIYIKWLEAQIDFANNEYARYNISAEAYNAIYKEFAKDYKENHMPKRKLTRFLF